jgi:hypothetical protein
MTRAEYENNLIKLGLDPDFPIQAGKRYRVTGFSDSEPSRAMYVWVSEITPDMVEGQVKDYTGVSFSKWSHRMASSWTWTEAEG